MVRVMLILGLVLSLAACGGSRTDGLSQADEETLEALLDAAVAERAQAEADKVAAEADRVAAEAAQAAAEAAQAAAEAAQAAAEAAQAAAEAAQAAAEADKAIAEADKVAAEAAQAAAEADKAIAEADKAVAEADKAIAEAERDQAEAAQAAAEADKAIAEAERDQAEADKVAAEADKVAAEADKVAAEADKVAAEADKAIAEAEAQHQLREAQRARQEAETARQEAETARLEAETARGEAETARQETETAEQAQERLAAEATEARQKALQLEAADALTGLGTAPLDGETVNPKYRAPASVSAPNVTFISPRGSSAGRWYATTASNQGQISDDTIVVYSDVGAPSRTPIMEVYGAFAVDEDSTNLLAISITDQHNNLITSSHFPTPGRTATIPLTIDSTDDDNDDMTAKLRGSFDGASGTFQCSGGACTVRNTGGGYVLDGTWTFRTSKTSRVNVPDEEFMHFGWWRKKTNETGAFTYGPISGVGGSAVSGNGFTTLEGSATYEGPAIGQYAIYQPLGTQSNHGAFKATARFTANFDTERLSGSVSGFDVSSGWSLTLQETSMANGTVSQGDVSWTIDGNIQDGGNWNGAFHSEIDPYMDHIPDGLAGEFNAAYGDTDNPVGRLVGAFGTHKK